MAQIIHNTSMPNDGLGDALRTAFNDVNTNTTELYNSKVDKVVGKDLSDNNYADADVIKLVGIEAGAEVNVQADFLQDDPTADDYIKNKDSFLIEQNNKNKYVVVITPTDNNSMTNLLTAINAMPIVVSEIETLKFEVNRNSGGVPFTEIYDTNDIGKGNYGSLGTDFVASDLRLIFTNFTTVESIESNPSNVVFTYATLGGLTISQYVTALDPAITLFDTNQTLFKVTDSGVSYLFLGVAGTYGVGFLTAVDSDFVKIPTSTLPITSGVFKQEPNGAIHRLDITDSTGGLNSTNLTVLEGRAIGNYSHADSGGTASGNGSHADSSGIASGYNSHADSIGQSLGNYSHADSNAIALGDGSHADSNGTASGIYSHADSNGTASGDYSHADSIGIASGEVSHADSGGTALGDYSSASGNGTIANSYSETAIGTYNENVVANNATAFNAEDLIFSIGIGSDDLNRLTSFFAFKNGGFKFISRLLTNITNATKGFFALDENARPNVHDGTQWQPIAYLSDISGSGIPEAPNNANAYVRSGLAWVVGYTKTAVDTLLATFKTDNFLDATSSIQTQLNAKVDKVSTAGVERAYIINADGSQGTKPTSDFKDVLEFANLAAFPVTGESAKIYITIDTNLQYRWTGSTYVQIGVSLNQKTINTSRTALATDNGCLIKIKGNATYTIDQATLPTGWNVIVRSFTGATGTFVASGGTTFDAPTGLILKPLKMCSIIKDSDDNKILINGETSLT